MSDTVSIHPYFQAHEGKVEAAKALLPKLVEITSKQDYCYWYDFSMHGDIIYCREAYKGAEGLLNHIKEVDPVIKELLKVSDLIRVEVHGPKAELKKLEEPLAALNPDYYEFVVGIGKPS